MTQHAHTPGPWHRNIKPAAKYNTIFAGDALHLIHVAHLAVNGLDDATIEANCNLIIEAPAMLAALEEWDVLSLVIESAVRNADPGNEARVTSAIIACRAVIARARGGA